MGHTPPQSEARAWRTSLPYLGQVMALADLPERTSIALEVRIPYYAKRIDALLFGHDAHGRSNAVIVELKAWSEVEALADGNVQTVIGGRPRVEPHPSAQAQAYRDHLSDFCKAFQGDGAVTLWSCAYCHNYTEPGARGLFDRQFDALRQDSPTFGARDADRMAEFLRERLVADEGPSVVAVYDQAGVGPSRQLVEHASEVIRRQNVFRLLDEQIAANNAIMHAVDHAARARHKHVILVRGGPGTGKSVIALNAFGRVLAKGMQTSLVSGSGAFTWSMRRLLGRRLSGLVRYTDYFWDYAPDSVDVLLVDEAHRIRAKSQPKVPRAERPRVSQAEELIRAARVSIFFVDENQIISPEEVGEPELIRETAARMGAQYEEYRLPHQFRCGGSDAYLDWLDDMLRIAPDDQELVLARPSGFDFAIVDTPHELLEGVRRRNRESPNSARLLAGWCWPWSEPNPDGTLVEDIVIGDFHFPWELKPGRRAAAGIPEARLWAIDPGGADQAGTVYSMQGFEADHVGVIIAPDLVVREGNWRAQPRQNYSNKLRGLPPERALPYFKRIYRTLLARGIHSCSVFCVDPETRMYIERRLAGPR